MLIHSCSSRGGTEGAVSEGFDGAGGFHAGCQQQSVLRGHSTNYGQYRHSFFKRTLDGLDNIRILASWLSAHSFAKRTLDNLDNIHIIVYIVECPLLTKLTFFHFGFRESLEEASHPQVQ